MTPWSRLTPPLALLLASLGACKPGLAPAPAWSAAAKPVASGTCPDVDGTFLLDDPALMVVLGWPERGGTPVQLSVAKPGTLSARLRTEDNTPPSPPPPANTLSAHCADGWLQLDAHSARDTLRNSGGWRLQDPERDYSYRLGLRKNAAGELVVRTASVSHASVSVWCGDGCKSVRIPGTGATELRWAKWPAYAIELRPDAPAVALQLVPGSVQAKTIAALRQLLPRSTQVRDVSQTDARTLLVRLHLAAGLDFMVVEEAIRYWDGALSIVRRAPAPEGGTELLLRLGLLKVNDDAELATIAQARRDSDAALRAASELFLGKLPAGQGVQLSGFHSEGGGQFRVELRLPPGLSEPQFLTQLRLDGDFIDLSVRSSRPHPMGGTALTLGLRRL